eukprot:7052552-Prymnesium_polylepis.1
MPQALKPVKFEARLEIPGVDNVSSYVGARFGTCFACPPRHDAQFRGRLLGPRDLSLPLAGVTAH